MFLWFKNFRQVGLIYSSPRSNQLDLHSIGTKNWKKKLNREMALLRYFSFKIFSVPRKDDIVSYFKIDSDAH